MYQSKVKKLVVSVVIHVEETICAVIDVRGNVLARDSFATPDYPDAVQFVMALRDCILALVEHNGGYDLVRSVGISTPSGHFTSGSIVNAPNMAWKGVVPLAAMLQDQLGLAVAVANNAYVTALAEHAFGVARGMRDFVVVTIGSGLGSCIFANGKAVNGAAGFAGEVGHTCVVPGGRLCGCGNKGCLEMYTAGKGIVITAREVMQESDKPSLMRGVEALSAAQIADFCEAGDELAIETYRRAGEMLGKSLANYMVLLDPEAFIFSGKVIRAGKWLLDPCQATFERHVLRQSQTAVKFLVSEFDQGELELLGASVLAWDVKEYSLFK